MSQYEWLRVQNSSTSFHQRPKFPTEILPSGWKVDLNSAQVLNIAPSHFAYTTQILIRSTIRVKTCPAVVVHQTHHVRQPPQISPLHIWQRLLFNFSHNAPAILILISRKPNDCWVAKYPCPYRKKPQSLTDEDTFFANTCFPKFRFISACFGLDIVIS